MSGLDGAETRLSVVAGPALQRMKAKALEGLDRCGLCTPPTVLASAQVSVAAIASAVGVLPSEPIIARLCKKDAGYPSYDFFVTRRADFAHDARELVCRQSTRAMEGADWIIQPLIDVEESAGILVGHGKAIVEEVVGAPRLIFRMGEFQQRRFLGYGQSVVDSAPQARALRWSGSRFEWQVAAPLRNRCIPAVNRVMARTVDRIEIFECGWARGEVLWFDAKVLSDHCFPLLGEENVGARLRLFGCEQHYDVRFDRPGLEYLGEIRETASVLIGSGAVTAHLCVNLAERRIPACLERQAT